MKRYVKADTEREKIVIDTGLSDPQAIDVIHGVLGQLSDGIWENSPAMEKYWKCLHADGGKITFFTDYYKKYSYDRYGGHYWTEPSPFRGKSEQQLKQWFATKVKQVAKQFESDYGSVGKWDRNNTNECDYLNYHSGATVQDAYRVYDTLLGRKQRIPNPGEDVTGSADISQNSYVKAGHCASPWDYIDYDPNDGWTPEDIELHKSIDWSATRGDYVVEDDCINGVAILYGVGNEPVLKHTKFCKHLRPNPIFPPYYAPIVKYPFDEKKYPPYVGPMADGRKYKLYDIHDRYETQTLYDALFD